MLLRNSQLTEEKEEHSYSLGHFVTAIQCRCCIYISLFLDKCFTSVLWIVVKRLRDTCTHTHTYRNCPCLRLSVFLPASSGGCPSPASSHPSIHPPYVPGGHHISAGCALCPSIGARSWGEAWLRPSPRPRELGSTDSCIKYKAAEGKCSRAAQQLL